MMYGFPFSKADLLISSLSYHSENSKGGFGGFCAIFAPVGCEKWIPPRTAAVLSPFHDLLQVIFQKEKDVRSGRPFCSAYSISDEGRMVGGEKNQISVPGSFLIAGAIVVFSRVIGIGASLLEQFHFDDSINRIGQNGRFTEGDKGDVGIVTGDPVVLDLQLGTVLHEADLLDLGTVDSC